MKNKTATPIFPSLFKGVRHTKSESAITWDEVFALITGDRLRENTEKHRFFRVNNFVKDAERIKHSSPCITPAVQCQGGRRAGHIVGYTGVSMVDFDHVPDLPATLALLRADPHTFMLYTTLSGEGVRVLYRWEAGINLSTEYALAFQQGNDYFSRLTGLPFDPACKDAVRLSALCHDEGPTIIPTVPPSWWNRETQRHSGKREQCHLRRKNRG